MTGRIEGKVGIVTGSTRGIGEGIICKLAAEGASVIVSGIEAEAGEQVARNIQQAGQRARFVRADVTKPEDCTQLIAATLDYYGRLDVLVNNAGIFPSLSIEDTTPEVWDEVFAVNVRGAYLCCRAAIPAMKQRGGSIINIGSGLAYRGTPDRIAYSSSKGALLTLTRVLAQTYIKDRIRVNWITPGWVASPGELELRDALTGDGTAYLQERGAQAPFGRLETPEDIAAGVLYLASDEASHVTGCELNIGGGRFI